MTRAQAIVHKGKKILMVNLRVNNVEWWCLPGGRVEPAETPETAVLRELKEECCVEGRILRQTAHATEGNDTDTISFLIEIGNQEPKKGFDPEVPPNRQSLVDMRWLSLAEIAERDRAYLFAAGLLSIPEFLDEVSNWGDAPSYPV
jgi:ADP-ribose pyrophosphatase YjhB (NUDIX family)